MSHDAISSRKWDHGSVPSWIKGNSSAIIFFSHRLKFDCFPLYSATSSYTSRDPPPAFEEEEEEEERDLVEEDRTSTPQPQSQRSKADRQEQMVKRSRWHTVLSEAGGISAALSNESMQRLQVCLHRLQV
jgi:hypothetical protein